MRPPVRPFALPACMVLCAGLAWAPAASRAQGAAAAVDPEAPFGIAMGAPASRIPGATLFKPGWYAVGRPPRPEPGFVKAAVEAFPETGVCVVQGVGPVIDHDPEGSRIRAAVDDVANRFSASFGQPEKVDSCDSLICAPEFWGQDMQTGDRRYGYRWTLHGQPAHGAREISIIAVAHSASAFVYLVQYDSEKLSACRAAETATLQGGS
jgi:hypothetical protein